MYFSEPVERPKLLTDIAVERIRRAIVMGPLQFGQALSESTLASMLGISKTPVREALLRLRHEGLVEIHPQRGTFVFQLDESGVEHISQFRTVIECEALADGIRHRHAQLVQALDACGADMDAAVQRKDFAAFPRLDTEFHNAIVQQCDNPYLKTSYAVVAAQVAALRYRLPPDDAQVLHCHDSHDGLVEAIRARDARKAQSLLRAHIQGTRDSYLLACRAQVVPPRPEPALQAD